MHGQRNVRPGLNTTQVNSFKYEIKKNDFCKLRYTNHTIVTCLIFYVTAPPPPLFSAFGYKVHRLPD